MPVRRNDILPGGARWLVDQGGMRGRGCVEPRKAFSWQ